jgi:lipoyl(octanoyl) transferase
LGWFLLSLIVPHSVKESGKGNRCAGTLVTLLLQMNQRPVIFKDLGKQSYKPVWDYQEQLLKDNVTIKSLAYAQQAEGMPVVTTDTTRDYLLLVEHPPVYTLGKNGKLENLLISESDCAEKGIDFFKINRGGDITFHGPGQIVGYPILDLEHFYTDIGRYLRNIEEVIIQTLAEYGIQGDRSPGETGVWIDPEKKGKERKICAIGVRCSRWITMHGFAFNVNTDLTYFDHIIPCGIQNKQVTSLQKELGYPLDLAEVKQKVKRNFERVFDVCLIEKQQDRLD